MSDNKSQIHSRRAIEVGFPIVEINRLAEPERSSFKPIYQMHKWFARRASCVFRAILLGALKPAYKEDGTPVDLMAEFYKDHNKDPDTTGKVVLDPFMGGGTTVVEALRLGCKVVGIDLNPVAWFIVKTEVEPVEIDALKAAFERLAARPVAWNNGKPMRETLLDLYKTEVASGIDADVIYTFWVKHAICTDPTCKKEVPLFKDYFVAAKTVSVRYHRDTKCPECKKTFDWEVDVASLIAEPAMMVNSSRGSGGEGRPTTAWTYTVEPPKPKKKSNESLVTLDCPHCEKNFKARVPWDKKKARKKVQITVMLCPSCEAVWQWRGPLPEGELSCPACNHNYDPSKGNLPEKGYFQCRCGNKDRIIESIRLLPQERRLPVRPYALQAYVLPVEEVDDSQQTMFGVLSQASGTLSNDEIKGLLLPKNGKFFKRWSASDQARLQNAERLWEKNKAGLPYPKSVIPNGAETARLLQHHYNQWHDMFGTRQLLALSTLLEGIMAEKDEKLMEMLLCAYSNTLEANNLFTRHRVSRSAVGSLTAEGVFARHDFQTKITTAENNVFGLPSIAAGSFLSEYGLVVGGVDYQTEGWDFKANTDDENRVKIQTDKLTDASRLLHCANSAEVSSETPTIVVTDPPYVGNVNYSELADFFYVWLRLALKGHYSWFAPEYTPKTEEVVENRTRGKSREDFYKGLSTVFQRVHDQLPEDGLLIFTFHHTDQAGTVWEGLLQSLCDTGFEIAAVYPVHSEAESSLHLMDKENISFDLIHVCRKRKEDPTARSWAGIRQEVRRLARAELLAIEAGRYGNKPLPEPDVRLICIGKCLELYSTHYDKVLDHEGMTYPLHKALQDISSIVDQLVTRERPLPPELEEVDFLTYAWLRLLAGHSREVSMDKITKSTRALQVSTEDLKKAGLIVKGRTGRGRTYEVKQPRERLEDVLSILRAKTGETQEELFEGELPSNNKVLLVDLLHALIALSDAGESVLPWLERFDARRSEILAGLRYVRQLRSDWEGAIDRVIGVIEGAPLLRHGGAI
ncbi:MAG: DNA methyltransferase [Nitrospirota bacterium]|nr:DNA methyltransferase [Nitrospirota bacterium]